MKKKEMIVVLLLLFGISQIFAADCGDVNNDGVADIIDALLVAQFYVGLDPQPFDQSMADVNGDGSIDIIDGLLIAQYYVGLIPELTGCGPTDEPTPTPGPTDAEGLIAFPGAEGYGKLSVGGRGGAVYEVTTLSSSGAGSLGAAISASGPRTVVFKVAGNIEGTFNISNDYITIAGQTAPGDGIVIIRYIRVRANASGDAISGGHGNNNIILDHVSASWSSDEVLSIYQNDNVTFQWCIISEACGGGHNFGGIWGNWPSTYHHNLIAHNLSRNPRWASSGGAGDNDYRNNVIYNWGYMSCYGGAGSEPVNMVANYYKAGPATESGVRDTIADPSGGVWYVADNYVDGYPDVTADNWLGMDGGNRMDEPWPAMPIRQQTAEDAYVSVLDHAGCSLPNRDSIDSRIIEEVRTGTATFGNNGIINNPSEVGGWPNLASGTAYTDSDHDGMPDSWENAHGLNPNDPDDRNNTDSIGYTMLENFLNSIDNL